MTRIRATNNIMNDVTKSKSRNEQATIYCRYRDN